MATSVLVDASMCNGDGALALGRLMGGVEDFGFSSEIVVTSVEVPEPGGMEGLRVTRLFKRSRFRIDRPSGTYGGLTTCEDLGGISAF